MHIIIYHYMCRLYLFRRLYAAELACNGSLNPEYLVPSISPDQIRNKSLRGQISLYDKSLRTKFLTKSQKCSANEAGI